MTRTYRRTADRMAAATIAVAIMAIDLAVTGCGPNPQRIVAVVVTATSAEPAPVLPPPVRLLLEKVASDADRVDGALVRLIVSGDAGIPQQTEHDLTPYRREGQVEHSSRKHELIADRIDELERSVADAAATGDGLELLGLLDQAAAGDPERIVVLSSGLSTVDPVDWRVLGWEADPALVAGQLAERRLLPDLGGQRIEFHGIGRVAGSQPVLPPPARALVADLWAEVCHTAGGERCDIAGDGSAIRPPVATRPVPVVEVSPGVTPRPGCSTRQALDNSTLGFRANSAELHADADVTLLPYAELLSTCAVAEIVGHVADVGPGDGAELSLRRAAAVAERLRHLGACPAAITGVTGHGDSEPVEPNWNPDGSFSEPRAARNRRVELLLTATAAPCA